MESVACAVFFKEFTSHKIDSCCEGLPVGVMTMGDAFKVITQTSAYFIAPKDSILIQMKLQRFLGILNPIARFDLDQYTQRVTSQNGDAECHGRHK